MSQAGLHDAVLRWYADNARDFPWRRTRDPYRTLVAEVMLQQTQTSRVAPIYRAFLRRFPSVGKLATAEPRDVITAWEGLGYNRRAVALHLAAKTILTELGGRVPSDPEALRALPGIGPYTSSAVACFAFDRQVAVVDTNVRRVLARAVRGQHASADPSDIDRAAHTLLPPGRAYGWNQALMDLGATICTARNPKCDVCPLARHCRYRKAPQSPPVARRPTERFQGSRRQARGAIIGHLRRARGRSVRRGSLEVYATGQALNAVLTQLESEGLIAMSAAARAGSDNGLVWLPSSTREA